MIDCKSPNKCLGWFLYCSKCSRNNKLNIESRKNLRDLYKLDKRDTWDKIIRSSNSKYQGHKDENNRSS
jgi:hypothetical protein